MSDTAGINLDEWYTTKTSGKDAEEIALLEQQKQASPVDNPEDEP